MKFNMRKKWIIALIVPFILVSCRVMLIGAYDEVTDQSIQQIQNDVSSLLVSIEKDLLNGDTSALKYVNYKSNYDDIEGQLQSVIIRADALPKYKLVTDQLVPFDSTIRRLESFHKLGFSLSDTASLRIIKKTVEFDFQQMITLQNGLKRSANN